jgi:hypothetical protein
MKQTAVEWFWNNLTDDMIGDLHPWQIGSIYKLIEQAKAMEKEQHKQTWLDSTAQFNNAAEMTYKKDFEKYFNETFNNNG